MMIPRTRIPKEEIPTKYRCVECNGIIHKVVYHVSPTYSWYRWTCSTCDKDFGYETPEPLMYKQ